MKRATVHFYLFFSITILFLSSCKLGEKYKQPALNLPDSYRGAWDSTSVETSFNTIQWRDFFNDTVLIALIDSGLANNFDMRIALKNMDIADRNLRINKLEYLPSIDANLGTVNKQYRSQDFYGSPSSKWYDQKGEGAPKSLSNYQSQYATSLAFSWEIDVWGRIANQKDVLKADWLNSREVKNAIQTKLIADIASGYFNSLKLSCG